LRPHNQRARCLDACLFGRRGAPAARQSRPRQLQCMVAAELRARGSLCPLRRRHLFALRRIPKFRTPRTILILAHRIPSRHVTKCTTMPDAVPPLLATMQEITGTLEFPGGADNPVILAWRDEIARRFPEMGTYCAQYTHDEIPWCGLTVGYCMAHNGIRPVFGPTDTDKFLWAQAWKQFGSPADPPLPGDVLVLAGHVTLYDGEEGASYLGRGGNQSDSVKVSHYPKSSCQAIRRPPAPTAADRLTVKPIAIASSKPFAGITATVFGGQADRNLSAYDEHLITDSENGVALPARFRGERPKVRVSKGDKSVVCDIVDVGPWYDGRPDWPPDRYWETGARPRAESDSRTNGAGIDLAPAVARALGIDGKGKVDWEFVGATPSVAQE